MEIYNRWGELLFYSNEINLGWNGMLNQEALPIETYIYSIKYKQEQEYKVEGNITLLR